MRDLNASRRITSGCRATRGIERYGAAQSGIQAAIQTFLEFISDRLRWHTERCSRCGKTAAEVVAVVRPRPHRTTAQLEPNPRIANGYSVHAG